MAFSSWYYGMDDASAPPFPCTGDGPNVYLGIIGGETSLRSGYFDEAAATTAGKAHTFAVWDVAGPNSAEKPSGMSAEDWGIAQANAFHAALDPDSPASKYSPYAEYVGGLTFFGDIESDNGGWDLNNEDNNTATLFGFLDTIWGGGPNTVGIYIHNDSVDDRWANYFGANYTSQIPIVVWVTGGDCESTCADAAAEFNATYADMTVGGYKVMIWQYHPSSGCGSPEKDFDITPYAGYQNSQWNPQWNPTT